MSRNSFKKRIDDKGVTLVEVMITLAVLSIMAVPIFNTFNESLRINNRTMITVTANHVGQQVMESLKADGLVEGFVISEETNDDGKLIITHEGDIEAYHVVAVMSPIENVVFKPDSSVKVPHGNEVNLSSADVELVLKKEDGDTETSFDFDGSNFKARWGKLLIERVNLTTISVQLYTLEKNEDGEIDAHATGKIINVTEGADPSTILVKVVGTPDKGRVDIENRTSADIDIYEVDDGQKLLSIVPQLVADSGQIRFYRNVRSNAANPDNETSVYNVDVKISKNSDVLEQFVGTFIKK